MNNNVYRDASLFNDGEFDEMQKTKNYEIGFKLFRDYHFVTYLFATAFVNFSKGSVPMTVTSFLFMGICLAAAVMYAAKTSAAGVMNIKYAKLMSRKIMLVCGLVLILAFGVTAVTGVLEIRTNIMLLAISVYMICFHIFARRNMKVLEKMLKDESEEE